MANLLLDCIIYIGDKCQTEKVWAVHHSRVASYTLSKSTGFAVSTLYAQYIALLPSLHSVSLFLAAQHN